MATPPATRDRLSSRSETQHATAEEDFSRVSISSMRELISAAPGTPGVKDFRVSRSPEKLALSQAKTATALPCSTPSMTFLRALLTVRKEVEVGGPVLPLPPECIGPPEAPIAPIAPM